MFQCCINIKWNGEVNDYSLYLNWGWIICIETTNGEKLIKFQNHAHASIQYIAYNFTTDDKRFSFCFWNNCKKNNLNLPLNFLSWKLENILNSLNKDNFSTDNSKKGEPHYSILLALSPFLMTCLAMVFFIALQLEKVTFWYFPRLFKEVSLFASYVC